MKSFNTNNIILLPTIMSSDPSLNPDHPLHGFEYIASNKKGDMYKKNDEYSENGQHQTLGQTTLIIIPLT